MNEDIFIWDGVAQVPNDVTNVRIQDGVTTIRNCAFKKLPKLTSVTIPDGVTTIGMDAFAYCPSLTSVNIPDSVTIIDDLAFYRCKSLTSIIIGNGVTSIGDEAFRECSSLTRVTLGDNVKRIGTFAFWGCTELSAIAVPDKVKIGKNAFGNTNCKVTKNRAQRDNHPDNMDDELDDLSWTELLDELDGDDDWMDSLYQEFCADAYELVEEEGFTDVFTEPSTQGGRGADFFWAKKDGVAYEGHCDYETEQEAFWDCCYEADSREEAIKLCAKRYAEIILNNLNPVEDY